MIFMEKKSLIKFIGLILFLFILIYFFNFTEFGKDFKTQEGRLMQGENLEEFISGFGFLSPLVFIIIYAVLTALLFPGIILSFVGAVLFGVVNGTIYNLIGAVIGASLFQDCLEEDLLKVCLRIQDFIIKLKIMALI